MKGRTCSAAMLLVSLAALLCLACAPRAEAAAPKGIVSSLGSASAAEAGALFATPRGVAVNQSGAGGVPAGTFYVVDSGNRRIQRFAPGGDFVSAWGWGVEKGNTEFAICAVALNCQKGSAGSKAGQFGNNGAQGVAVDQGSGRVYVSDQASANRRISVFGAKGEFQGAFGWGVRGAFATELQFCTSATGCGGAQTNPAEGTPAGACGMFGTAIGGLAVDGSGDLYVANRSFRRIDVFRPVLSAGTAVGIECRRTFGWNVVEKGPDETATDEFEVCNVAANPTDVCREGAAGPGLGQFAAGSPVDLSVDSGGSVFAVDNNAAKRVQRFSPLSAPSLAEFGSAPLGAAFAGGELLNIAIDPFNDHVLVSGKRSAQASQVAVVEMDHSGGEPVTHGLGLPVNASASSTGLGGLAVARASLGGNVYVSIGTTGTLHGVDVLNGEPAVTEVGDVTGTTAVFRGRIISNEIGVTYHFEYSADGQTWVAVPLSDVDAGTQAGEIAVEQEAVNLTGSQHYFVRLVQNRPAGGGVATSDQVEFTTAAAAPAILGTVASPVKDTGATLNAYLDPQNEATTYRFEYGTSDCSALPGSCVSLPAATVSGGGSRLVAQSVTGLAPGTPYHYRLVAVNASGRTESADAVFETAAPNGSLPDGRAYELVTPGDSGAIAFNGLGFGEAEGHGCFDVFPVTPDGASLVSMVAGGSLPGLTANGNWDLYESVRGGGGWVTVSKSPSGAESAHPVTGGGLCSSPDHLFSTLTTGVSPNDGGTLVIEDKSTSYVRGPDGTFTLVGQGTEGIAPETDVRLITPKAGHVVFTSKRRLEPAAPPSGTEAIYDRSPGGPTRVVSLLPGEVFLAGGEDAEYLGASLDGSVVAFEVGGVTYARVNGAETQVVAAGPSTFAGISRDGGRVFYSSAAPSGNTVPNPGDLFAYDTAAKTTEEVAEGSDFVNVSDDGSSVYFLSNLALAGSADSGDRNLYVWEAEDGDVDFIAAVLSQDVVGGTSLARWANAAVSPDANLLKGRANDPSRSTPDGSVFLFESRGNVTGYDSGGHVEIYRFDADGEVLDCVSCPPLGVPAQGDARLAAPFGITQTSALVRIQNVTDDGETVFFQTEDPLLPRDVNGTWDVYEWKAGQQAYLITSGQGQNPSLIYGMTPSGSDLFFTSTERLLAQDPSNVSSIYDARVGGGFAPPPLPPSPCEGDACQGVPATAPSLQGPGSAVFSGPGNQVMRRGKAGKKHRHRQHKRKKSGKRHRRAGSANPSGGAAR